MLGNNLITLCEREAMNALETYLKEHVFDEVDFTVTSLEQKSDGALVVLMTGTDEDSS